MVGKQGLHGTLMFLVDALKGNDEGLSSLFGNVRALSNVLGTAGAQGESYKVILDSIANSTGMVDKAFENVAKTSAFKFDAAIVSLKNNAIELGVELLPIAVKIADKLTNMAKVFRELSPPVKKTMVTVAGLAAALGPLAFMIGATANSIASGIRLVGKAITKSNPLILAASVAVGLLIAAWARFSLKNKMASTALDDNTKAVLKNQTNANLLLDTLARSNVSQETRNRLIDEYNLKYGKYGGNLSKEKTAIDDIRKAQVSMNIAFREKIVQATLEDVLSGKLKSAAKKRIELVEEELLLTDKLSTLRLLEGPHMPSLFGTEEQQAALAKTAGEGIEKIRKNITRLEADLKASGDAVADLQGRMTDLVAVDEDLPTTTTTAPDTGGIRALEGDALDAAIATLGLEHAIRDLDTYILGNRRGPEDVDYAPGILGLHNMALGLVEYGDELRSLPKNKDLPKIDLDLDLGEMSHVFSEASDELDDFNAGFVDLDGNIKLIAKTAANSFDIAGAIVTEFGNSMQMAFQGAIENGESFWENMKNMLKQLTIKLIAAAAAAIVLSIALTIVTGGANIGGTVLSGLDLAKAIFSDLSGFPKFAEGGMVFGPTLAMVGDNRNASVDPEVIAPLSKLKAMMGGTGSQNITVTGRLRGADLLISNERAGRQRSRYRGF
tara:strand:+ start:41 stop:2044 length:2004 start_codon:yes stop_codon:yes gene_type:complete